ncbi:hypothetical protein RHMOL_Rhmol08G0158300 [Rhododendron molle]|uniref:Uncharacterized protein n=1 Tax=Rhododendron molle TaxID=49168 RepID=A0ACC0MNZ2_RHOML|nr:hypothetical protein RHMOL_Rhmol08G0158300 [Rhododendron molle]
MLSTQKDAMIADMVDSENQGHWKFQFTRRLHDWEEDQLNILGHLLNVVQLQDSQEDSLQRKWSKDLSFLVNKGILNSNFGQCLSCNSAQETPNHLLLLCDVAKRVWEDVIFWCNLVWVCPPNLKSLLAF